MTKLQEEKNNMLILEFGDDVSVSHQNMENRLKKIRQRIWIAGRKEDIELDLGCFERLAVAFGILLSARNAETMRGELQI